MDRNIITRRDVERQTALAASLAERERKRLLFEADKSPTGEMPGPAALAAPTLVVPDKKPDTWYEKILKFIPMEAVAMYLALDGLIRSAAMDDAGRRACLGGALAIALLFTYLYLKSVAKVRRASQVGASLAALITWVFALGGVFSTFAFYAPWQGTAALVVVTAFLGLMPVDAGA